jgi:hypothetical protein
MKTAAFDSDGFPSPDLGLDDMPLLDFGSFGEWDSITSGYESPRFIPFHRRRKNKIKKGDGPDAKGDPNDHYPFYEGFAYSHLRRHFGKNPPASVVFEVCRAVVRLAPGQLSEQNRWAKRRLPNAYAWLDANRATISDALLDRCLSIAA